MQETEWAKQQYGTIRSKQQKIFRFYFETKFKNSDTGEPWIMILLWLWSEFDSDRYDSELASRNTFFLT